jgi:hypothetical protein
MERPCELERGREGVMGANEGQKILCEFRRTAAVYGGAAPEAQRLEDRRHLHASQALVMRTMAGGVQHRG